MPTSFPLLPGARRAQSLLLLLVPRGGQDQARRNAWAAVSAASARTHERRLAQEALRGAEQRGYGGGEAVRSGTGS